MSSAGVPTFFPIPKDNDDDDVVWAMQTALVQWKRGGKADAVVWIRRAADSADGLGQKRRATELRHQAALLAERMWDDENAEPAPPSLEIDVLHDSDIPSALSLPPARPPAEPPAEPPVPSRSLDDAIVDLSAGDLLSLDEDDDAPRLSVHSISDVDELLSMQELADEEQQAEATLEPEQLVDEDQFDDWDDADDITGEFGSMPEAVSSLMNRPEALKVKQPVRHPKPAPLVMTPPSQPPPAPLVVTPPSQPPPAPLVPTPSRSSIPPAPAPLVPKRSLSPAPLVPLRAPSIPPAPAPLVPPPARRPRPPAPPPPGLQPPPVLAAFPPVPAFAAPPAPEEEEDLEARLDEPVPASVEGRLSARRLIEDDSDEDDSDEDDSDEDDSDEDDSDEDDSDEDDSDEDDSDEDDSDEDDSDEDDSDDDDSDDDPLSAAPLDLVRPQSSPAPPLDAPALPPSTKLDGFDLASVTGFEDMPLELQTKLAASARVDTLAEEEEVGHFGAALVTSGRVKIAPAISDLAGAYALPGQVVFTRGSLEGGMELRVIAAEPGTRVASWNIATIDQALADCPWVADDLRALADRFHSLSGVTLGVLGEGLDESLIILATERMEVVRCGAGEVLLKAGSQLPGLYIVGAGKVELLNADQRVTQELAPGDFVFASEEMSARPAPQTVAGGAGGALLLFAPRALAHELITTIPPLLEVLTA